jgi:DNA-binding XRE family transcriptional regulator
MTANPDETLDHRVPTPADLAEIVKVMRATNKWSQATLAELARVTERTVQRVENGEPSSLDTRRALAGAFRCQDLDVFERPWPFPNVDKLKARAADLEQTTVALSLTRIRDTAPCARWSKAHTVPQSTRSANCRRKHAKHSPRSLIISGTTAIYAMSIR